MNFQTDPELQFLFPIFNRVFQQPLVTAFASAVTVLMECAKMYGN